MGTTPRFGLRYQELADEPNGPVLGQNLAQDVEGWLARAYRCTSLTRPPTPTNDMIIRETDTGDVRVWTGSTWAIIGGASGGGGFGTGDALWARFTALSDQSIPTGVDTPAAFGGDEGALGIVRETKGVGHRFKATVSGLYQIDVTIRYAATASPGERYAGLHLDATGFPITGAGGNPQGSSPVTLSFGQAVDLIPTRYVYVNAYQGTGSARLFERGSGSGWVNIKFARIG